MMLNREELQAAFETAWQVAANIKGWLAPNEGAMLFQAACEAPEGGAIVEIGSYRGKSTSLLASTGRNVVAIDPLYEGTGQSDNYEISGSDAAALASVVAQYPSARWIRKAATEIDTSDNIGKVSMLYIDGNHQPPHPTNDFRWFQDRLLPGAMVCFHDYGDKAAVGHAIKRLEREGTIERVCVSGLMYLGRYVNKGPQDVRRVFIGVPYSADIKPVTWDSLFNATLNQGRVQVNVWRSRWSLLNRSFNDCLCECHKRGDADYFMLLHSDIGLKGTWLEPMVDIAERHGFDALHAIAAIKNDDGLTSTAVAYSDDPWQRVRRITTTECMKLPDVFDIDALRKVYDPNAKILLPNTGALLLRYDEWLKDFPGFSNLDRIRRLGPAEWEPDAVPEDWCFGFWAAKHGLKVGATKLVTRHVGEQIYSTEFAWGHKVDPAWAAEQVVTAGRPE